MGIMEDDYFNKAMVGRSRWMSYYFQLSEVFDCKADSVLEIGIGNSVVAPYLKSREIQYTSLDICKSNDVAVVGSVTAIPFVENSFHTIICAEVLEHLPFEFFEPSLKEILRVTKEFLILTLPISGINFGLSFTMPYLSNHSLLVKLAGNKKHVFNGLHYWEIGKKGFSKQTVIQIIEKSGFKVIRNYIKYETPYNIFFVLTKVN